MCIHNFYLYTINRFFTIFDTQLTFWQLGINDFSSSSPPSSVLFFYFGRNLTLSLSQFKNSNVLVRVSLRFVNAPRKRDIIKIEVARLQLFAKSSLTRYLRDDDVTSPSKHFFFLSFRALLLNYVSADH